jgi:hypothetical protein
MAAWRLAMLCFWNKVEWFAYGSGGCNPVGVDGIKDLFSQGSLASSATLGFGIQSRWD